MTIRLIGWVLVLSTAVACSSGSGSPTGTATINGMINGHAFQAADAIAGNITFPGTTPINGGFVTIASSGGLCADVNANKEPKSTQYLFLAVTDVNLATQQTSPPTAPGVYTVQSGALTPPKLAIALYRQTDASCHDVAGAAENAVAGSITVTSVNNGSYSGTFDLTMATGAGAPADRVTGSFNAPNCAGLSALVSQSRTTTCF